MLPMCPAFRSFASSLSTLALWIAAVPALAEVPSCIVVEARAVPAADGSYDHSLTFTNNCEVRMRLRARYSDAPDSAASGEILATGDTVTITLGVSQFTQGFSAYYDVRFKRGPEARSTDERATGTVRSPAPRSETRAGSTASRSETTTRSTARGSERSTRSPGSSAPPGGSLSLVDLCNRAVRKMFRLQGLSEKDPKLNARIVNCPSRVNRDPQKRRAELECILGASTREDVRVCFGAK